MRCEQSSENNDREHEGRCPHCSHACDCYAEGIRAACGWSDGLRGRGGATGMLLARIDVVLDALNAHAMHCTGWTALLLCTALSAYW